MIEQFINFVIRPPRAEYSPDQYLWEKEFTLAGRKYCRQDLEIKNDRGHALQCSHYLPSPFLEDTSLPCVIYCHGNSGCRADANEAAVILLPSNITVFTLDFSGSGLSDGDFVSLGWHEKDDLKAAVSYLRNMKNISCIGLWGRSMGAVTSLLYGAEDPSIAGMVKVAVQYMRRVIQKRAGFDIMDLNVAQIAPKTFIPALFGHATEDVFIQPHHSDSIFKSYAGDKNIIKFEGDHNSARPQFYYDSVSIFFYNVLRPPQMSATGTPAADKYFDLGALRLGNAVDETLLYEIITGIRMLEPGAASSSSAPCTTNGSNMPLPNEALHESESSTEIQKMIVPEGTIEQHDVVFEVGGDEVESCSGRGKGNGQNDDCSSYSSSNRESWGRCSSLGVSDEESSIENFAPFSLNANDEQADKVDARKGLTASKKVPKLKSEKLEALGQRVRLSILKRIRHKNSSST